MYGLPSYLFNFLLIFRAGLNEEKKSGFPFSAVGVGYSRTAVVGTPLMYKLFFLNPKKSLARCKQAQLFLYFPKYPM